MTPLPPFTSDGLLPPGDHALTFAELRASHLVVGPPDRADWAPAWRARLVDDAEVLVRQLWAEGVQDVFLGGSFVEDVPRPRDLDGYFPCPLEQLADLTARLQARDPFGTWTWDDAARRPEPGAATLQFPMWHVYRVELYPDCGQPSGRQGPGGVVGFPAMLRQRSDFTPKGIVRLVPDAEPLGREPPFPAPTPAHGLAALAREAVRGHLVHARTLEALASFFQGVDGVVGAWSNGSLARAELDRHSDLDLGIVLRDPAAREALWAARDAWAVPRWFHRLDGDHYRPYFRTILFEPGIKVDLSLSVLGDWLDPVSAPYVALWDQTGEVSRQVAATNRRVPDGPDWGTVVHDDERFWSLAYSLVRKLERGDAYEAAAIFPWLRDVVERWHAYLSGRPAFLATKVERREPAPAVTTLAGCFPHPETADVARALLHAMDAVEVQRAAFEEAGPWSWRTQEQARARIRALAAALVADLTRA